MYRIENGRDIDIYENFIDVIMSKIESEWNSNWLGIELSLLPEF